MARSLNAGGSQRQMVELALALDPAEFEVHVGCFHDYGIRAGELRRQGVPVLCLPVRSFLDFSAARGVWILGRYLRRHRIQLVHTFDSPLPVRVSARGDRCRALAQGDRYLRSAFPQRGPVEFPDGSHGLRLLRGGVGRTLGATPS
jgi:hypothetical protein